MSFRRVLPDRFLFACASLLAVAAALGGCATGSSDAGDAPTTAGVTPVAIHEAMSLDASTFSEPGAFLFKREADFEAYRRGRLVDLEVDWDDRDVVVVALGMQPTGGYWAQLRSAQLDGGKLYVQGRANRPGPDAAVTQALTFPVAVAVIDKTPAGTVIPEIDSVTGRSLR